jgi:RNA polymerase sigma-70 factor (ECF subfamily)
VDVEELIAKEEPLLAAAEQQDISDVRAAMLKLPDEYREPLVLQVLLGYSTAEIAREMDLSGPAVLTRLCRARRQMRAACGEDTTLDPQD